PISSPDIYTLSLHDALPIYKLNSITVYSNYSVDTESQATDTVEYQGVSYIQQGDFFRPDRLAPFILLDTTQYYNPLTSKFTSNRSEEHTSELQSRENLVCRL